MNKQELAWQLKHSSSEWIYVVTWNNLLMQLFCPFKVAVNKSVGDLKKGQIVLIEAVKVTIELKAVFMIKGQFYHYYYFEILVD
ncbi:hypothetical protein OO009_03050 [Flavobacteriaceae bacterium KMM 6897]|nr:hypothetical protein [Flavobacteriaceae bacterium KMM 6897]